MARMASCLDVLQIGRAVDSFFLGKSQRPIITGCLQECGVADQTCVTSCEVCVEQNECKSLGDNCDECLSQARMSLKVAKFKKGDKHHYRIDSGGGSLVHDGLRNKLINAKLTAVNAKRQLLQARNNVLKAQRQAEWADEERSVQANKLHESKLALEDAESEVAQWKLHHEKKLKEMRVKRDKAREEAKDAEHALEETEEELEDAEKGMEDYDGEDEDKAEERVKKLEKMVDKEKQEVVQADDNLKEVGEDADWLDRGLREEVAQAERRVKDSIKDLRVARAVERQSRDQLEEAKVEYKKITQTSTVLETEVVGLESKIQENPLPPRDEDFPEPTLKPENSFGSHSNHFSILAFFMVAALLPSGFA